MQGFDEGPLPPFLYTMSHMVQPRQKRLKSRSFHEIVRLMSGSCADNRAFFVISLSLPDIWRLRRDSELIISDLIQDITTRSVEVEGGIRALVTLSRQEGGNDDG